MTYRLIKNDIHTKLFTTVIIHLYNTYENKRLIFFKSINDKLIYVLRHTHSRTGAHAYTNTRTHACSLARTHAHTEVDIDLLHIDIGQ